LPQGASILNIEKVIDATGSVSWNVTVQLNQSQTPGVLQNQLLTVQESSGKFYVAVVQDRTFTNQVLLTKFYDASGVLTKQISYEYYSDGTVKTSVVTHFENGVRTKTVRREFNANGVITRLLIRNFYPNGVDVESINDNTYVGGVRRERIHKEFAKNGTLLRKILFTYYADGESLKIRDDFRYTEGKRYYSTFDSKGNLISTQVYSI
jgi:hypothetical protein